MEIIRCIADAIKNCADNRKLIPISERRVAVTVPKTLAEKGRLYLVAIYTGTDIPLILVRRAVKIGSSIGFVITSPALRKLAEIPSIRVRVCVSEAASPR